MIVNYKTILNGNIFEDNHILSQLSDPTNVYKYVMLKIEFCCDKMKGIWGDSIGFGEWVEYPPRDNTSVNLYYHCGCSVDSISINVCPFCGESISTVEKEVTKLEKYIKPINQVYHREVKVK